MLVKKINNGNSFHGQALRTGYVHIPVVMQTTTVFFDMLKSVTGGFIVGHFVHTDEQMQENPFHYDFILDTKEIINGRNSTDDVAFFHLYILDDIYYKKIVLPAEFTMHFILKIAENNHIAQYPLNNGKEGILHSAIIPGVCY